MIDLKNMGKFLQKCRKDLGLSQEKAAELTELTEKTIRNLEGGKCMPELDTISKLCDIYHIGLKDIQQFYYRSENMAHIIEDFHDDKDN